MFQRKTPTYLKLSREAMEVFAGLTLLFVGFIASFLMAVGLLEKDIILSLVVYSLSLAGIVVGLHGVLGWQHAREKIGS